MTALELARLVEFSEAATYVDMFRAAPASFGFVAEESSVGTLLMAPKFDATVFNRVMGLGLAEPPTRAVVSAMIRRYRDAGVRKFAIQISPQADPTLAGWLGESGLTIRDRWTKVYRANLPPASVATDLRIEQIGEDRADVFGRTACAGFGMPPVLSPMISATVGRPGWLHYIAFDPKGAAAAVAALFVEKAVGRLCIAATLPDFRRRGAQGALMSRRIADGIRLGCKWFITETGEDLPDRPNPSFHNMVRNGFVVAYHRPNFMESQ